MKNKKLFLIIFFITITLFAYAYTLPKVFKFDKKNALNEWQEKIFKNRVLYIVEPEKNGGQLLAKSKNACSGLFYKIRFDSKRYPMISWKWRVIKFPEKDSPRGAYAWAREESLWDKVLVALRIKPPLKKPMVLPETANSAKGGWLERDDYAARVYVIFPSWFFPNTKCIEYVWSENLPKGQIMTSPYFANIKLIVVESGKKNTDEWAYVERNIYNDYRSAFGRSPSIVGAIALMTDTDNTMSTAEALYADIKVGYKND
ncbi:MAG: DUF3047 domain-containing protein [Candidatus Omnitrophota bacterium]|jgi:hypothetical protein